MTHALSSAFSHFVAPLTSAVARAFTPPGLSGAIDGMQSAESQAANALANPPPAAPPSQFPNPKPGASSGGQQTSSPMTLITIAHGLPGAGASGTQGKTLLGQ